MEVWLASSLSTKNRVCHLEHSRVTVTPPVGLHYFTIELNCGEICSQAGRCSAEGRARGWFHLLCVPLPSIQTCTVKLQNQVIFKLPAGLQIEGVLAYFMHLKCQKRFTPNLFCFFLWKWPPLYLIMQEYDSKSLKMYLITSKVFKICLKFLAPITKVS
jgi:hypothetical protein